MDPADVDDFQEDFLDLDIGQQLEDAIIEDAAAAWYKQQDSKARRQQPRSRSSTSQASSGTPASGQQAGANSSSSSNKQQLADEQQHLEDVASGESMPQISKLLHDNPPCCGGSSKTGGYNKAKGSGPDIAAVSATAAVGGVVALTGSLLSYALARARSSKRERKLKEGLRRKEAALASMRGELEALKSTAARMIELEQELAASNTHLLAMNQEVERARMASKRIEGDMALFQDQLQNLSSTEAEIKASMAAAEAKAVQAEQRRQEAEAQRRQAEERWQAAKQQLEHVQTEVETLRGELGVRGSQMEGLTRELEFTRRQLANAEKCVEKAQMEKRQQRSGYGEYDAWD